MPAHFLLKAVTITDLLTILRLVSSMMPAHMSQGPLAKVEDEEKELSLIYIIMCCSESIMKNKDTLKMMNNKIFIS